MQPTMLAVEVVEAVVVESATTKDDDSPIHVPPRSPDSPVDVLVGSTIALQVALVDEAMVGEAAVAAVTAKGGALPIATSEAADGGASNAAPKPMESTRKSNWKTTKSSMKVYATSRIPQNKLTKGVLECWEDKGTQVLRRGG